MAAAPLLFELPKSTPVTVPAAAYAAGVSAEAFRAYLRHPAVRLLVPRKAAGAWLRTAPADVVRLAVLGHLIRFGFTIAEAHLIIVDYVDRRIEGIALSVGDVPWPMLESWLRGNIISVSREADGVSVSVKTYSGRTLASHTTATLSIHLGCLVTDVRRRLRDFTGSDAT